MVTRRGIEANLIQLKAIMESQAPTYRKGVQKLTGQLAALGRFISRFTYRLKPLFATLKGAQRAGWNQDYDQALAAINQYLTQPPILASPKTSETLYLYVDVSDVSVGTALFKEDEHQKQRPIFFTSKSLSKAETRYTRLEQATLALRVAAKKLRPYFQAHPIIVLTNLPLRRTIHKPDMSGLMARWAVELSEFSIQYKPSGDEGVSTS